MLPGITVVLQDITVVPLGFTVVLPGITVVPQDITVVPLGFKVVLPGITVVLSGTTVQRFSTLMYPHNTDK